MKSLKQENEQLRAEVEAEKKTFVEMDKILTEQAQRLI